MKGFDKILKFKISCSYENARKIADDIIVSLMKNTDLKEEEKIYLPTYTSTVRETHLGISLLPDEKIEDLFDYEKRDKMYSEFIIEIFEVTGNRRSRLSVTQNKEFRDMLMN